MKIDERKKISVHLDFSSLKASYLNQPLSSKRSKIDSISPNNSYLSSSPFSAMKHIKPLKTTNNSLKKILGKENIQMSKYPLLVDQFIKLYALSKQEQAELLDYKQVFYYKQPKQMESKGCELGCGLKDHIHYRYEVLAMLGQGSFGQVFKVQDHKTNKVCAVKIIKNQEKLKKQAALEASILKELKNHDTEHISNIVEIEDAFIFRGHQCIVFEKLEYNLYDMLKKNHYRGIDLEFTRKIAIQLLNSLNYLSKMRVIHCDIKPENVMLQQENKSGIKLVDFGSSCYFGQQIYTYIQSRFYRAPEVIFGLKYGPEIDMWSFACVIAELQIGSPIFPGEDEVDQINLIMQIIGPPNQEFAQQLPRRKYFFDSEGNPKKCVKQYKRSTLYELMNTDDTEFIDFLLRCFTWEAENRLKPLDALKHPWILQGLPKDIQKQHKKYIEIERKMQNQQNKRRELKEMMITKKQSDENYFSQKNQKFQTTNISSRYSNSKPNSIERNRSNIALSIHQLLNKQKIRKPSFCNL